MLASRDYDRRLKTKSHNNIGGNYLKIYNLNTQIEILTPIRKEPNLFDNPKYKISTNPHTNSYKNFDYVKRPNNYIFQHYSSKNLCTSSNPLLSKINNHYYSTNTSIPYKNQNKNNKINDNKVNIASIFNNTVNNSAKKNELLFCVPPNIISYSNIIGNINYSQNNTYNDNFINNKNKKNKFKISNNKKASGTENRINLAGMPNMISLGLNEVYKRVRVPNKLSKYIIKNSEKNDEEEETSDEKNVVVLPCSKYKASRKSPEKNLKNNDDVKNNNYNNNQYYNLYGNNFLYDDREKFNDSNNENNNRNYFFRSEQHRRNKCNYFMGYLGDSDNHSGGKVNLGLNNPCQKNKDNFNFSKYKIIRIQSFWRGVLLRQTLTKKGAARKNIFYRKKYFIKTLIDSIHNYLKRYFILFVQILRNILQKNYKKNPTNLKSSNYKKPYNKIKDGNKIFSDLYKNNLDENKQKNCFASPLKFYVPEKVNDIRMKGTPNNHKETINFSENKLVINGNLNKLSIIDDVNKEVTNTQKNKFIFQNISPNKSSQFSISKSNLAKQYSKTNNTNNAINNVSPYHENEGNCKEAIENINSHKLYNKNVYSSLNQNENINNSNFHNKKNSNDKLNNNISTYNPINKNVYSKKLQKSYTNKDLNPSKKLFETFNNKNPNFKYDSQEDENTKSLNLQKKEYSEYMEQIDNENRYRRFDNVKIQKPKNYLSKKDKYKKYLYFCFILPDKIKKICAIQYFEIFLDGLLLKIKSNNEILKKKLLSKIILNNTKKNLDNFFKFYKEQILTEKIREKLYQNQVNTSQNQSFNQSIDNNHFNFLQHSASSKSNENLIISYNNNISIVKNDKINKKKLRESILRSLVVKLDDERTKYFYKWKKMIIRLIKAKRHVKVKYFGSSKSKSKSKSKDLQRSASSKRSKNSQSPYKKMNVKKKHAGIKKEIDVTLYKKLINILQKTDHVGLKNYFYAWKGKKQIGYNRKKFLIYFIMNIKEYFYSDISVRGNEEYLLGKTMFLWYRKACH